MVRNPQMATISVDKRQYHAKCPDGQRDGCLPVLERTLTMNDGRAYDDFLVDDMRVVTEVILDEEEGQDARDDE